MMMAYLTSKFSESVRLYQSIICFLGLWFLPFMLAAQADTVFNQGGAAQAAYYAEIPFTWEHDKIFVEIVLAGKPRKFLVDTGAPTVLSRKLVEEMGLAPFLRLPIADIFGQQDSMEVVKVPELVLGGIRFEQVPALLMENDLFLTKCLEIDGFIGSNLLRNSVLQFRLDERILVLTDEAERLALEPGWAGKLMRDRQSGPVLTISLGKKEGFQLLFDSGADELMSMSDRQFQYFRKKKLVFEVDQGVGSGSVGVFGLVEPSTIKSRVLIPQLRMGGGTLGQVLTETHAQPNSRLGSLILEYGTLTLDYAGEKYYFAPKSPVQTLNQRFRGLGVIPKDDKIVVGEVWEDYFGLVEAGEQVVQINGYPIADISPCEILKLDIWSEEPAVLILIDAEGKDREITVQKKTYRLPEKKRKSKKQ